MSFMQHPLTIHLLEKYQMNRTLYLFPDHCFCARNKITKVRLMLQIHLCVHTLIFSVKM